MGLNFPDAEKTSEDSAFLKVWWDVPELEIKPEGQSVYIRSSGAPMVSTS